MRYLELAVYVLSTSLSSTVPTWQTSDHLGDNNIFFSLPSINSIITSYSFRLYLPLFSFQFSYVLSSIFPSCIIFLFISFTFLLLCLSPVYFSTFIAFIFLSPFIILNPFVYNCFFYPDSFFLFSIVSFFSLFFICCYLSFLHTSHFHLFFFHSFSVCLPLFHSK